MKPDATSWSRVAAVVSDVDASPCNPVHAACTLQGGLYHWTVQVGERGSVGNVAPDWDHLQTVVEQAVHDLVDGPANVSDASDHDAAPVPLFYDIRWSSPWLAAAAAC